MSAPLLSIVIANFNYGRFLETAILSVITQDVADKVELIVCDGGSTDNSVEIIKKYSSRISWWVSEKDKGQSDAFNKGFLHAKGKYLTWLNADDVLVKGSLKKIIRKMERHPECEWFTGNFYRFTQDGKVIEIGWGPRWLPFFLQTKAQPPAVYGPTTFFSKSLFERVGRMKEYQYFQMDTDLWRRFIVSGVKQRRIPCFCWGFRMHESSKTAEFGEHKLSEEQLKKFDAERARSIEETGYRMSKANRLVIQMWRVLDGSFLKRFFLKCSFRRVEVV